MIDRPRPVLLVFTLGAGGDCARRPLLPARLRDAEVGLRRSWLEAALAAGLGAGCRVLVSSPQRLSSRPESDVAHLPQRGTGFGDRLADALDRAFAAAGGEPVVVVGSDAPGLTADHVRQALDRLRDDPERVVAGPSPDGGFYLLAAARPIPGLATGVRWCRGEALASLRRTLAAAGRRLIEIAPLADLDRPADLDRWLARGGRPGTAAPADWRRVIALIRQLLALLRRPAIPPRIGLPRSGLVAVRSGRGPPRLS